MTPTNNPPDKRDELADSYELPNRVKETVPDPLVTVFTVTYQHAHYIRDCIEGVLMQKTTFPVEYVIGEDCSTDGTREIVLEYAKKYPDKIRVVTADRNVGLKANAERCRKALRGKYAALCEGDDYWTDPLKLQKQVEFLEANPVMSCATMHTGSWQTTPSPAQSKEKTIPGMNWWPPPRGLPPRPR